MLYFKYNSFKMNVVFVPGNYEEEMKIRYHLKKPELLQLIKDNDSASNYKNVKKILKKKRINRLYYKTKLWRHV